MIYIQHIGICVLNKNCKDYKEKVIIFTESKLEYCREKRNIRNQTKKRKPKFDDIVLPETPNGILGYHPTCYRYFTAGIKKPNAACKTLFV